MIIEGAEAERGLIWLSQAGASYSLLGSNGRSGGLIAPRPAVSSAQLMGDVCSAADVAP